MTEPAGTAQETVAANSVASPAHIPARQLLLMVIPALVIGVISALVLIIVSGLAAVLQDILWTTIPDAMGVVSSSPLWILLMLTLTGAAVGLVVWKVPGHAGPDPATTGLVEPPLPLYVLPSLLLALILTLAGGVSLGPENPIMAVNASIVVALGTRLIPKVRAPILVGLSSAGMIAAMFGTPVAAALVLSESTLGDSRIPLWDRLFVPLVAAGAASITMVGLVGESFSLSVMAYPGPELSHLFTGAIVATLAALLGLAAVYAFPYVHSLFHRLPNPLITLTVGGLVLGVLGIIGGPITLFKGLEEMKELTSSSAEYSAVTLGLLALIKLAAMLIGASAGFRGGRIFPCVFVGVAFGLCANAFFPSIPQALTVSCAVAGMLLAITRQGWLSLFMAAIVVPDTRLIPILCLVSLPAWLIVSGKLEMQIARKQP